MTAKHGLKLIRRFGPALAILALVAAAVAFGLDHYISLDQLRQRREALEAMVLAHPFISLELYLLAYVVLVGLSFPAALVMTLTGGFLFGPLVGGPAAAAGATLGACVIFLVCRNMTGDFLRRRAGPTAARIEAGVEDNAFLYLLSLRLIPVMPFWLINLAAGLLGAPARAFIVATVMGILPAALIYASLGAGLDGMFNRGEPLGPQLLLAPRIALPLIGLALLSTLPIAHHWWRARRNSAASAP